MPNEKESFLNCKEASDFLVLSERTLREYVKRGMIPHYRSATGRLLFKKEDLDALYVRIPKLVQHNTDEPEGENANEKG